METRQQLPEGEAGQGPAMIRTGLEVLAQETFELSGEVPRLVTFLNQALKDRGLIFGVSRSSDQRLILTIYRT